MASISGAMISNNLIYGDYSTGCIANVGAASQIIIQNNTLYNGHMIGDGDINAIKVLAMAEGTGGLVMDNRFISDVQTALLSRTGDDMVFINNMMIDTDGDEFSGGLESGGSSVTITPTT